MKAFKLLLFSFLITNCASKNTNSKENIYWVHSAKVECTGVSQTTCLQIQKGNSFDINEKWNLFYSSIEGFEYEPGYIYKLKLRQETNENTPADGSSTVYSLVKILEKNPDTRYNIHDIYVLKSISGKEIDSSLLENKPTMEINITNMQISGNNGCNNYSGTIRFLKDKNISFGSIRETRMMCKNMEVPTEFSKRIEQTATFIKDNRELHLLDTFNKSLLTLKKID